MGAPATRAGLVGKAPCQADFLRLNATRPIAHHLHRWLSEGLEAVLGARGAPPQGLTAFVYTAPGEKSVLVGAFAPSSDKVGRSFPLAVFTEWDARDLSARFPLVPQAFRRFLEAGSSLLDAAVSLDAAALAARLDTLAPPAEEDFGEADELRRRSLAERHGAELLDAVGEREAGMPYYAFRTFLAACAQERGREPQKASVILDCPLSTSGDPLPWLELASRALRWRHGPPSFFWSGARLLISLGPPTPSLLGFLANPAQTGSRLWSLRTPQPAAVASARQALPPQQRQAIDAAGAPIEELLKALAS